MPTGNKFEPFVIQGLPSQGHSPLSVTGPKLLQTGQLQSTQSRSPHGSTDHHKAVIQNSEVISVNGSKVTVAKAAKQLRGSFSAKGAIRTLFKSHHVRSFTHSLGICGVWGDSI
jgi:hypothetical protein